MRTSDEYKEELRLAMKRGFDNHMSLQSQVEKRFCITPNWDTKTARMFTGWLKERLDGETVEKFGDWWYAEDWRGKQGQPPTLYQIRELWPQAFKDVGAEGAAARHKYLEGKFADIIIGGLDDEEEQNEDED